MQLRNKVLDQISEVLESENISIASVCYFMQSIRIFLEIDDVKTQYPITNHYCNWILHKNLTSSNSPQIIKEISEAFGNYTSKNDLIKKINKAVSIKKLVTELKEILWKNMPDKKVISLVDYDDYWIKFIHLILNQIMFRPLELKKRHLILDGIEISIYGIQITINEEQYTIELLSQELESKSKRILIGMALFSEH